MARVQGWGWRVRGFGGFRREGRAAVADLDQGEQPAAGRLDRGAGEVVSAEEGAVMRLTREKSRAVQKKLQAAVVAASPPLRASTEVKPAMRRQKT